ncbi:MAG: hypothetical protein V4722_06505 [Bacteroidota bacterium]
MKKYIIGIVAATITLTACEKKVEPIDSFDVVVEYRSTNPKVLTSDVTLNPKDSIYFDFTITSPTQDMAYVEIQKNGTRIDTFRLTSAANKRSFSFVKGYRADSIPGSYTYRVLARDAKAVFMGDGKKEITVTIRPDFDFWSYRILQVPDTTNKTNKCYYSTSDGKVYSFTDGAANSAKIDFGYYYDTTGTAAGGTNILGHSIYALNVPQPRISFYDITPWTKNATIFKVISTNFVSNLTSGGAINTIIGGGMTSGTATKLNKIASGNVIGFKTATGKFGAILIRYLNQNNPNKETQIEVDVKVQK